MFYSRKNIWIAAYYLVGIQVNKQATVLLLLSSQHIIPYWDIANGIPSLHRWLFSSSVEFLHLLTIEDSWGSKLHNVKPLEGVGHPKRGWVITGKWFKLAYWPWKPDTQFCNGDSYYPGLSFYRSYVPFSVNHFIVGCDALFILRRMFFLPPISVMPFFAFLRELKLPFKTNFYYSQFFFIFARSCFEIGFSKQVSSFLVCIDVTHLYKHSKNIIIKTKDFCIFCK